MPHYLVLKEWRGVEFGDTGHRTITEVVEAVNPEGAVHKASMRVTSSIGDVPDKNLEVYELAGDEHGDPVMYTPDDLEI